MLSGEPLCLSLHEAAKALRISARTLYELAHQGKVPHLRVGTGRGRLVFPIDLLRDWIRQNATGPQPATDTRDASALSNVNK